MGDARFCPFKIILSGPRMRSPELGIRLAALLFYRATFRCGGGWPLATRAQQPGRMRRVDVPKQFAENDEEGQLRARGFRERLEASGWRIGSNLAVDFRWGRGLAFDQSHTLRVWLLDHSVVGWRTSPLPSRGLVTCHGFLICWGKRVGDASPMTIRVPGPPLLP